MAPSLSASVVSDQYFEVAPGRPISSKEGLDRYGAVANVGPVLGDTGLDPPAGNGRRGDVALLGDLASRVAELERHGPAESDLPTGGEGREGNHHRRLGEPGKDAGTCEVPGPRHLLVAAPGVLGLFEIEPAFLAEHCDELEPAPGVDHLAQRGIDRERPSAEDIGGLP